MKTSGWIVMGLLLCLPQAAVRAEDSAMEVFEQRIMPIFRSPNPSSCVQCHLASVDLKDYILPSHEETFLSLRDQGLIDLEQPSKSKILNLIGMGDKDRDALAKRIHAKTRTAELEAFTAWIEACCNDKALVSRPVNRERTIAKPNLPDEVIRHARKDRVLDSFVRNVWSQRMRCFPCHTPHEIDSDNPKHKKPLANQRKLVKEHGARMNLFKKSPRETMRSMLATSRKHSKKSLPMVNLENPAESLLLLKPTAKLPPKGEDGKMLPPSSLLPVSHMGGLKIHVDDMSYKAIIAWIEDVAQVKSQQYASAADLPRDNWHPTKKLLRVKDLPADWPAGGLVQMFVYEKSGDTDQWKNEPIAFTQGIITPRRLINGNLMSLATGKTEGDSDGQASLRPGPHLVKLYLDTDNEIRDQPSVLLGESQSVGEIEFEAEWKEGLKNADMVSAASLSE